MDYYEIGQRIRKIRKACGLSQEELAERVGISTTHMSHIETGNTKLSLAVLVAISEVLDVRTDELIFGNPKITTTDAAEEISMLLESCDHNQKMIILDMIKSLKLSMDKHK